MVVSMYRYVKFKVILPFIYRRYAKFPINERKIIFLETRMSELSDNFKLLHDRIVENYDMDIHMHFLREGFASQAEKLKRSSAFIKDLATAKYLFLNDGNLVLSCVKVREETVVTQTWHGCGAFKKFGFSTASLLFGATKAELLKYPVHSNYTHVTVSSPEVVWAYEEAMNLHDYPSVVKPIGVSRTDVFYDDNFVASAKEKLQRCIPQSNGKLVILYAPTYRGRMATAQTSDMLNVSLFKERLSAQYVLVIKHHPLVKNPPEVPVSCLDFARDVSNELSIEEVLCATDICISDYSSLVYEYALFEKPMIFFAYDLEEYFDWRGFYYNYDELAPGPIFTTNLEMLDYIEQIEERFEPEKVKAFRDKFMCACDGHATKRLMELVFEEEVDEDFSGC